MSDVINLNPVLDEIIEVMEKHGLKEPAVAIAFSSAADRHLVHWMTNVKREEGIALLKETAQKMIAKSN